MDKLKLISDASLKAEVPEINIGSTVRVHVKIREGERERIQVFEGTVIAKKALDKGIKAVVFDRGGYVYHGRVAEVAAGAREGGLEF